jgi:hypothetical protein
MAFIVEISSIDESRSAALAGSVNRRKAGTGRQTGAVGGISSATGFPPKAISGVSQSAQNL